MEDFRRKVCQVGEGLVTQIPEVITYSNVITKKTVQIALTMAALQGLEVKVADVLNAYVTANNRE